MVIRLAQFNLILLLTTALTALTGCQTPEEEKLETFIRIHLEVNQSVPESNEVPIYRARPVLVNVQKEPFLTEVHVEKAEVVNALGGFAIKFEFNPTGTVLLEQYSATNPGRHFAIFCQFGVDQEEQRWLAAPQINQRISDGKLIFTPDCTREEADQIVRGLNNVVADIKRRGRK